MDLYTLSDPFQLLQTMLNICIMLPEMYLMAKLELGCRLARRLQFADYYSTLAEVKPEMD